MRVARTLTLDSTVIEEVADPVCGPGEVVCRVLASATCGSDVHGAYVERKLPAVLGHEVVGEVVAMGEESGAVAVGDVVVIHHHAPCGACRVCAAGHETLCEQFRRTRLDPGGFAELVRVEAALVGELLPVGALDPVAATCTEPLACALRAQDRLDLRGDDVLLVVGAGASGLLHIAAARSRGVARVLVAELDGARLARAVRWGAEPHDPGAPAGGAEPGGPAAAHGGPEPGGPAAAHGGPEPGGPAAAHGGPELGGRVDAAIVTTHAPSALAAAAAALGPGGRLCAYATPEPGAPLGITADALFLRELTVTSSWSAGPAEMRAALALLQAGAVPTGDLITHRFGLEDTAAALAAQRDGTALKAVVIP